MAGIELALLSGMDANIKQGDKMISSGYFGVSRETLFRLTKKQALQFVREMYEHGGRISQYEYLAWVQWINESHSYII